MSTVADPLTTARRLGAEEHSETMPWGSTGPQTTPRPHSWPGTSNHVVVGRSKPRRRSPVITGIGASVTRHDYDAIDIHQQTSISTESGIMILLKELAHLGETRPFSKVVEHVDWSRRRPDELTAVVDLALSMEMASLAIELAQQGARLFPDDERVQRAAQVLAPPTARTVCMPRARGLDASMDWLEQHAGEYQGQWVAVRKGRLLGAARSLEELEAVIGEGKEAISTLVTKVL